jgi:cell division protein FtsB
VILILQKTYICNENPGKNTGIRIYSFFLTHYYNKFNVFSLQSVNKMSVFRQSNRKEIMEILSRRKETILLQIEEIDALRAQEKTLREEIHNLQKEKNKLLDRNVTLYTMVEQSQTLINGIVKTGDILPTTKPPELRRQTHETF